MKFFYDTLYTLRDKYIPHKMTSKRTFPPWYSSALKKVLKEKHKFFRKYKVYGNMEDYESFSLLRRRAKSLEKLCYESYIRRTEESLAKTPKAFWSFIKYTRKNSSACPATMSYRSETANSGDTVCNLFAEYFQSTFLNTNISTGPSVVHNNSHSYGFDSIGDVEIVPGEIMKLLKTVNLQKGAGPDSIPPILIANCAESLVIPLCIIFTRSIKEGCVPSLWKSALVTPIHKSGDRNNIENYRPISKLCAFAKLFERVIYRQVYSAISSSFIPEQHGFLKNRSTVSNLLLSNDYFTSSMDSGAQVDLIFTDFSKAFDRIDHLILLQKLQYAGIHGNLFRWFKSYIESRTQAVVINGFTSPWMRIPSGVPQGSLLGPLLFVIFISDISACFHHSQFLLYADDTKIFKRISNINDCSLLQEDLNRFQNYCRENRLDLNVSKCSAMTISRKSNLLQFSYMLHGQPLGRINHMKDLGVILDSKLIFDEHIEYVVKKASRALGFVIRSGAKFINLKSIKILYCSFVRSVLEYASQVWNPCYNIYIKRIESIQRRFLKYLEFKSKHYEPNYILRCKKFHFLPLEIRRNIADIVYLSRIAGGFIDSPQLLSRINLRVPARRCRHCPPLHLPTARTKYSSNSFINRASSNFNSISAEHGAIDIVTLVAR